MKNTIYCILGGLVAVAGLYAVAFICYILEKYLTQVGAVLLVTFLCGVALTNFYLKNK